MKTVVRAAGWVLVYVAATCALYPQILGGDQGFGWDAIETYWPDLAFLSNSLSRGEFPLWSPYDRGGYPFAADPQPALYYPLQWLLAALGALAGGAGWWLIQAKIVLHHAISGATLHLFLRGRGLSPLACALGAVVWMGSTPMLIHKASNILWPLAWLPLVWLATDRLLARPSAERAVVLAAAVYLAGSAGSPPGFFYTLLAGGAYGIYRVASEVSARRGDQRLPWMVRAGGAIALAAALAVAALLIIVVPGLELAGLSSRAETGVPWALSRPLAPWPTAVGMLVPAAGMADAYPGVLALMLGVCGLVIAPRRDQGAAIFFAAAAAFFLALSFGSATPLLPFAAEHLPAFDMFRNANRYKLVAAPLLACFAAYGAAAAISATRPEGRRRITAVIALGVLALAGAVACLFELPHADMRSRAGSLVVIALATALCTAALVHRRRAATAVMVGAALFALFEPVHFLHSRRAAMEKVPPALGREAVADLPGVIDHRLRVYDEFLLEQRGGARLAIRDFRGYPAGDPLDLQRYREVRERVRRDPAVLEVFNVGYVLRRPHHRIGHHASFVADNPAVIAPTHFAAIDGYRFATKHPAPRAQWFGAADVVSRDRVLDRLAASEQADGSRPVAVLENDDAAALPSDLRAVLTSRAATPPAPVSGVVSESGTDELRVVIEAPQAGLVALNEIAYPGWQVWVDGQPAQSVRVNYLLRAVAVGPGVHHLRWAFRPNGYRLWVGLWLAAIVVAIGVASARPLWSALRERRGRGR